MIYVMLVLSIYGLINLIAIAAQIGLIYVALLLGFFFLVNRLAMWLTLFAGIYFLFAGGVM